MASNKKGVVAEVDDAEIDAEIRAQAAQLVLARRRDMAANSQPWWLCSSCAFRNHPRAGYPNTKCEQCGKDRDLQVDPVYQPEVA